METKEIDLKIDVNGVCGGWFLGDEVKTAETFGCEMFWGLFGWGGGEEGGE